MPKALDGVTVADFGGNLAAAYAAMLMAEQGARTVKIEPRGGEVGRGTPHFHIANRSKQSVFLDLASPEDRAAAEDLIRLADIVVCGYTPQRQRALGLAYDTIKSLNPRALLLSTPPLGSRGPWAEVDGGSDLAEALGAIYGNQWARSGNPVAMAFPIAAYETGVLGALAAVAALVERGEDGAGQQIEVSMLAGAIALQTGSILRNPRMVRPGTGGGPADPLGSWATYRLFEASDGRYLFVAPGNIRFWHRLVLALEHPELISDPRFEHAPWIVDHDRLEALKSILIDIFHTRPRDEWLRILEAAEVPCTPLMTRAECFEDPQVLALGMHREVDDALLGHTGQIGVPVILHRTPGEIVGPAPTVGAQDRVLEQLRAEARRLPAAPAIGAASKSQGPLEGLNVLDLGGYIAGAYGPMLLAQLGATVIKVESPDGDPFRQFGFGFMGWNQGKRAIVLDLRKPEAREIVHELARRADVVVENLRPGSSRSLGVDYETLSKLNPDLIQMTVSGFGTRGPGSSRMGFDPITQARSGVMLAHSGEGRSEPGPRHPLYLTVPISDYGAGSLSAFGVVLALAARRRLGSGQHCETSLIQAVMALQAGEFVFYPGRPNFENGAPELRGLSALHRAYQCNDGRWIYLAVSTAAAWLALRTALTHAPALEFAQAADEGPEGELAQALAAHFLAAGAEAVLAEMQRLAVPAVPVNRSADLFSDSQVAANELVTELLHPEQGAVGQVNALIKFARTQSYPSRPAPTLGQHSDEILRELGYDEERIRQLRAIGAVH
jgi:crotonobetainyl-CoA:carnitine CoA-transferase CaiB-like acyl-CoA transferase